MATRGAKPKPAHLRIVDGTTNITRHGSEADARAKVEKSATSFGVITRPKHLKGDALAAWKRYIEPAFWLDAGREPAAIAFCELWGEFRFNPKSFPSSKHGQMRAYMNELGLTDERNRGPAGGEANDEFFDD